MAQQLAEKFNLDCEVRSNKGKKVIVIKAVSYPTFLSLIDPGGEGYKAKNKAI